MKNNHKFLVKVNIISIVVVLALTIFKMNLWYVIGVLALNILILKKQLGIEKKDKRVIGNNILNVLIVIFVYYITIYLLGLYLGFSKNYYIYSIVSILKKVVPMILFIFLFELIRHVNVTKGKDSKLAVVTAFILFVLLDCAEQVVNYRNFKDLETIITFGASVVIPSIARNIMLMYMCKYTGFKATVIYRLLMNVPMYIIPIFPTLGTYLTATINVVLPAILYYITYRTNMDIKERLTVGTKKKGSNIFFYILIVFLLILMLLTSGYFKYYILSVGSGSMEPNINKGDLILIRKLDTDEKKALEPGQILVFKHSGIVIVHRIVEINKVNDDEYYFYTKGDNNNSNDGYPITLSEVIGTTNFRIRWIGWPTVLLNELLN